MDNLYYLQTLGIQRWVVRQIQQKNLYSYTLTKTNVLVGYLVLEGSDSDLASNCSALELINSIMNAFAIKWGNQEKHANNDSLIDRINQDKVILMINEATTSELLLKIGNKLTLPEPNSLILNPILKREVWLKLRNFT